MGRKAATPTPLAQVDLGLPEFIVIDRKENASGILYILNPNEELTRPMKCPFCNSDHVIVHKVQQRQVVDIDERGKQVGLRINVRRFQCQGCNQIITPFFPSLDKKTTVRLREQIIKDCYNKPFSTVASRYGLSVSTVRSIFVDGTAGLLASYTPECPAVLGIDEVHLQKSYIGVFVDVSKSNGNRIIELTQNRSKETVKALLRRLKHPERLQCVTMDMWRPYRDAVYEVFPDIPVVIDRFHIMKELIKCLDSIRAKISKNIQDDTKGTKRKSLKRNRFLILSSDQNLSQKQAKLRDDLLNEFPAFTVPYYLKEAFRDIYEVSQSRREAEESYRIWTESVRDHEIAEFDSFIETVNAWHTEIFNYFDQPKGHRTNARTESLNRSIRDKDRDGRGYKFDVLRAKVLFGEPTEHGGIFDFDAFD